MRATLERFGDFRSTFNGRNVSLKKHPQKKEAVA